MRGVVGASSDSSVDGTQLWGGGTPTAASRDTVCHFAEASPHSGHDFPTPTRVAGGLGLPLRLRGWQLGWGMAQQGWSRPARRLKWPQPP